VLAGGGGGDLLRVCWGGYLGGVWGGGIDTHRVSISLVERVGVGGGGGGGGRGGGVGGVVGGWGGGWGCTGGGKKT